MAFLVSALGCEASIPEQRFECDSDTDCPPEQRCDVARNRCHLPDGG